MKNRTEIVELTNMCMVYDGGRVLVQDKINSDWAGVIFPGGHVEKNESFTDAVIREVYEETGLTIRAPRLCGIKDWPNEDGSRYVVLLYKTDQYEGVLKPSEEGEVYWTELDELPTKRLSKDFLKLLRVFLEDDLSEYYVCMQDDKVLRTLK